jgi:hypothetical protein
MNLDPPVAEPDESIALPIGLRLDSRRTRLIAALQTLGMVLLLLGVAAIPIQIGLATWITHQSLRTEWAIRGPACPVAPRISRAALGSRPPPPFVYQHAAFAYQIGDASCEAVPEGLFNGRTHPVCQFDAPAAIQVTAAGRSTIFEPGVGHRATVTVRDGQVSCVIGGWFTAYGPLG